MTEEEIIQSMRDGGKHLEEGAKVFYKAFCGPMCRFFVNQGASVVSPVNETRVKENFLLAA